MSTLAFPGLANAGTAARTIVTIKGPDGDFHGKIRTRTLDASVIASCGSSCPTAPTVRSLGPATPIRQSSKATWVCVVVREYGPAWRVFFAKAKATPDCRGGRSRVLELVDGVPQQRVSMSHG